MIRQHEFILNFNTKFSARIIYAFFRGNLFPINLSNELLHTHKYSCANSIITLYDKVQISTVNGEFHS